MKDLKNIPPSLFTHEKLSSSVKKKKKKRTNVEPISLPVKWEQWRNLSPFFFLSKYFTITLEGHKRKEKSLDSKITSFRAEIFFAYRESRGGLALLFTDVTHGEACERKRSRGPVLVRWFYGVRVLLPTGIFRGAPRSILYKRVENARLRNFLAFSFSPPILSSPRRDTCLRSVLLENARLCLEKSIPSIRFRCHSTEMIDFRWEIRRENRASFWNCWRREKLKKAWNIFHDESLYVYV